MKKKDKRPNKTKEFFKKYSKAGIISWIIIVLIAGLLKIFQIYNMENKLILSIILIPLLILSIPLIFVLALLGFIFNPGMGYQTLLLSKIGITTIIVLSVIYYFFLGVFIQWIYNKIKK